MNDETKIIAVKGFNLDMTCRGYKFKLGESYTHEGPVEACESGFHSVEYPMDVFSYYAPSCSVYTEVEASGTIARHPGDSKVASAKLHIRAALTIPDLVARAIEWVTKQCNPAASNHATADQSASSATGDRSASSATGDRSASLNTGSNSSSEIKPHAEGKELHAVAMATGYESRARAPAGSAIVLVERNGDGEIVNIRASKIGKNGTKPDVWYVLKDNKFVVSA